MAAPLQNASSLLHHREQFDGKIDAEAPRAAHTRAGTG